LIISYLHKLSPQKPLAQISDCYRLLLAIYCKVHHACIPQNRKNTLSHPQKKHIGILVFKAIATTGLGGSNYKIQIFLYNPIFFTLTVVQIQNGFIFTKSGYYEDYEQQSQKVSITLLGRHTGESPEDPSAAMLRML
jgi:hypothetical protein